MTKCLTEWKKFLDEVTEDEVEHISDILHDLKPDDLSFGNIFGDKMRLIKPMEVQDTDLEQLKKTLVASGYDPDFSTGLATYYTFSIPGKPGDRPSTIILTPEQKERLVAPDGNMARLDGDTDEEYEKRKSYIRKKQVKVGKLLQKGVRFYDNAKKAQNDFEKVKPENFKLSPDNPGEDDEANADEYRKASVAAVENADDALAKLQDVFQGYTSRATGDLNPFQRLSSWWNKKSSFYRENPGEAEKGTSSSEYSVIYTRHPIDVLRMSDHENITSCHSPVSSGGGGDYYKCAVAEAHGHAPLAYVVKNSDLEKMKVDFNEAEMSDDEFLDYLERDELELFYDTERDEGQVKPLSRLRLRKYSNSDLGVSLAVPETRVYGRRFPSFAENVLDWAKENQPEVIKKIEDSPKFGTSLDLKNWTRHGGTYSDSSDSQMFHTLLGITTIGSTRIDSSTEDSLDVSGNIQEEWQNEVDETARHYNQRMSAMTIEASVEDDGGEGYYIDVTAAYTLKIEESEFVTSAFETSTREALDNLPDELRDLFEPLDNQMHYTVKKGVVVIEIPVLIEALEGTDGSFPAYDPDSFTEICRALDSFDNKIDGIKEYARNILKRDGVLEGGVLMQFAQALESESWYEWSYDVDDDYEPTSIVVETSTEVNFNDLINKIPVTVKDNPGLSSALSIIFNGKEIAEAHRRDDGDGEFVDFEVRSSEFENKQMAGFKSVDKIKEYARLEIAKMILRADKEPGGRYHYASRDLHIEVRKLMREEAGGTEGEFKYPTSRLNVFGPQSDDEYRMMYVMNLDDEESDEIVGNAWEVVKETDDEDILQAIFKKAFAKVAKISPDLNETYERWSKMIL